MTVMDGHERNCSSPSSQSEEDMDVRRGPWTVEEDIVLVNYISNHGEGRWNTLARFAGLKRTGKSCRLRWLNYLRPDVRRGNITPEEQLLILELHSRWGNRWSKIAQHLPGRTDNEIKNYWRTRVQKQAKQLRCDVNSKQFNDAVRHLWMPRLLERIRAANSQPSAFPAEAGLSLSPSTIEATSVPAEGVAQTPDSSSLSYAGSPDCYFQTQEGDFYSSSYDAGDGLINAHLYNQHVDCRQDAPLISPRGCSYGYESDQDKSGWMPDMMSNTGGSPWDVDKEDDDVLWYWRQEFCDDGLLL